ncbi:outer membrane protein [Lachnospiraceae bacterium JC7]|nr:outer membrane protein [Lachnospiraceae bacterium JC7]
MYMGGEMVKRKKLAALAAAAVLCSGLGTAAMAAQEKKPGTRVVININDPNAPGRNLTGVDSTGRPDGMDDTTWARLQDDVIDYDEINNLVEYRSVIARQQMAAIDNYAVNMNDIIDSISSSIEDMNNEISDLKEKRRDTTDENEKAAYTALIDLYSSMISASGTDNYGIVLTDDDGNVTGKTTFSVQKAGAEGNLTKLASSVKRGLHGTKVSVTTGMNSAFLGYQSLRELEKMYEKQVDMYQAMYDAAVRQLAVGAATELDVRTAEVDLQGAKIRLSNNRESLRSIKENMAIILGWGIDSAANVSIGEIPVYDPTYMAARNLYQDIEEARLYNVEYGSAQATAKPDITGYSEVDIKRNSTKENLNITMSSLYNTAIQAGTQYEAAQAGFMVAARQKASAERSLAAGLISYKDYYGAVTQYIASEATANISAINASSAVLNYQAALRGFV